MQATNKFELLDASCRVALAAYLHDLGKFAERAKIEEGDRKNNEGVSAKDINKQQYCPEYKGRYSHIHAAYTAIAMDAIEAHLPDIKKENCYPFASWAAGNMGEKTDSLINAAARHHKPETFLQWVIACADRLSSGFERSEFDEYNRAEESVQSGKNYLTARMEVLLEKISLSENFQKIKPNHRYKLKPLSPQSLIPDVASKVEPSSDDEGRKEYHLLWKGFLEALQRHDGEDAIPESHKKNLALWLDHFDSLWLTFTHAIPSATASKVDGKFISIPTDVSLYDHAKSTAALATALWRWHEEHHRCSPEDAKLIQSSEEYEVDKFLLIQGDMFGIQDFIFQSGGSSSKYASKLLRGRSFYVSLLAECAALRVLDALSLPSTSQITNAAGKFLIVAPNTKSVLEALEKIRADFDQWSLEKTQGRVGLGLAYTPAKPKDFISNQRQESFSLLIQKLFSALEIQKYQRLHLWKKEKPCILKNYLEAFSKEKGVCEIDGISPATTVNKDGIALSQLAEDQIAIGSHIAKSQRVLISRKKIESSNSLEHDILGFYIHFTQKEKDSGRFAVEVKNNNLLRCWDFSLPDENGEKTLWNGYARRYINGYVARFNEVDLYAQKDKYKNFDEELDCVEDKNEIKSFNHLACEDRMPVNESGEVITDITNAKTWLGTLGLHALKGDVDNLGAIFQKGYERPNFAKMAALSRQINAFFSIYLPWLCRKEFQNTYTVFAGGDDFFLIGPWKTQMMLADRMHQDFKRYVAKNEDIHFSVGFHLSKPGLPVRQLSEGAEYALEESKMHAGKNAVTCFGYTLSWLQFRSLIIEAEWLENQKKLLNLSTGFIYGLLEFSEMADEKNKNDPQKAIWRSQLSYRTYRWIHDKRKPKEGEGNEIYQERIKKEAEDLLCKLVSKLKTNGSAYHLPLYTYLYSHRD